MIFFRHCYIIFVGYVTFPTKLSLQKPNGLVVLNEFDFHLFVDGEYQMLKLPAKSYGGPVVAKGSLLSPMPGKIIKVLVEKGQRVKKGDPLVIMEAMKMEVC